MYLERFADDYDDEDETPLNADQILIARRRRAAVVFAANSIADTCMWDLQMIDWDGESGLPHDTIGLQESFVWRFFPPRFRSPVHASVPRQHPCDRSQGRA